MRNLKASSLSELANVPCSAGASPVPDAAACLPVHLATGPASGKRPAMPGNFPPAGAHKRPRRVRHPASRPPSAHNGDSELQAMMHRFRGGIKAPVPDSSDSASTRYSPFFEETASSSHALPESGAVNFRLPVSASPIAPALGLVGQVAHPSVSPDMLYNMQRMGRIDNSIDSMPLPERCDAVESLADNFMTFSLLEGVGDAGRRARYLLQELSKLHGMSAHDASQVVRYALLAIRQTPILAVRNAAITRLFKLFEGQENQWIATVLPHCCAIIKHLPLLIEKSDAISRIHQIADGLPPDAHARVMKAVNDALPA